MKAAGVVAACVALLLGTFEPVSAQAREGGAGEKRFALVIGNGRYASSPLRNPVNDARAMASALRSLGFDVILQENASYKEMRRTIIDFGNRLRDHGVGVFYYAGHGVQVNGRNYMVPVDAVIAGEAEVSVEAVDVESVLSRMESARNQLNIVILDACRDDPFTRSFRSPNHGLASIDAPIGTLIAYATAPGHIAKDGDGPNGLYTSELLKAMRIPGLKIEDVFKRVRQSVSRQTNGKQVPWESSSLIGDFLFTSSRGGAAAVGSADLPVPPRQEVRGTASVPSKPDSELAQVDEYIRSKKWALALPLLRAAVRKDSAEAMWHLGTLYAFGYGVPRDQVEAFRWYLKAAEAGHIPAIVSVGGAYQYGWGIGRDLAEALRWFRKAADAGDAGAMNEVGRAYGTGEGVTKDAAEALRWFRKAADAGSALGLRNLGFVYQTGLGVTKDDVEAARWYRKGADAGDAASAANLALMYLSGWGVAKDLTEAIRWLRKSADGGNAVAMHTLGVAYASGEGVTKDAAEALRWFRKAADAGSNLGMRAVGWAYQNGLGIAKSDVEAILWYRQAAEAGNNEAMNDLGVMYQNGSGVARDEAEAVQWYRKSAEAGNTTGMRNLGFMYASGWGVEKDEAAGLNWMRKSAEAGDVAAMRTLGTMFQNGVGVVANQLEAIKWYKQAASLGDKASIERLNALSRAQ